MRSFFQLLGAAVVAVLVSASGVSADCAPYVTTAFEDGPGSGTLIGEKSVTVEFSGAGFGLRAMIRETTSVGYYRMVGGGVLALDCSDYSPYVLGVM